MEQTNTQMPALTIKEPLANKVDYTEIPGKIKDRPEKMGVEGKDQLCINCQLYSKVGENKQKEFGICLLFPKHSVLAQAWCRSWIKKHQDSQ